MYDVVDWLPVWFGVMVVSVLIVAFRCVLVLCRLCVWFVCC